MGHIYSPDELREGAVPTAADYETAILQLKSGLQHMVARRSLYGATSVGSLTCGDYDVGSDIDMFVILESHEAGVELRDLTHGITATTHVYFDIKAVTRSAAESGRHHLLYFYLHTIRRFSNRWIIGADPAEIVADRECWKNIEAELRDDFLARIDFLMKGRIHTRPDFGQAHCNYLDRIVTLPVYAAIGVVRLRCGGHPTDGCGQRLDKMATCRMFSEMVPGDSGGMVLEILRRKAGCRESMNRAMLDIGEYCTQLQLIDDSYILACSVLEQSVLYLDHPANA